MALRKVGSGWVGLTMESLATDNTRLPRSSVARLRRRCDCREGDYGASGRLRVLVFLMS